MCEIARDREKEIKSLICMNVRLFSIEIACAYHSQGYHTRPIKYQISLRVNCNRIFYIEIFLCLPRTFKNCHGTMAAIRFIGRSYTSH